MIHGVAVAQAAAEGRIGRRAHDGLSAAAARRFVERCFRFFIIPWEIETFFYFVERGFARRYLFYKTRHRISDLS